MDYAYTKNTNIDSIIMNIYKHGKYYNPAWSHYEHGALVSCDRCYRTQLITCLGWNQYDMCLKCADEISSIINIKDSIPYNEYKTKMQQDMFRNPRGEN